MKQNRFGRSPLVVSEICIGTMTAASVPEDALQACDAVSNEILCPMG